MDPYLTLNTKTKQNKKILDILLSIKKGSHNKARKEYKWSFVESLLLVAFLFLESWVGERLSNDDTEGMVGRLESVDVGRHISTNKILPDA